MAYVHNVLRLSGLLVIVALFAGVAWAKEDASLPLNGGFETIAGNGLPADWKCAPDYFAADHDQAHSGKTSLRSHKKDAKDHNLAVQFVNLNYDRTYNLSAWVKTSDVTPGTGGARVAVEWTDPQGNYLGGAYSDAISSPDGWTSIDTGDFAVPPGAKEIQIICWMHSTSTGTAWFDDVQIQSKPEALLRTVLRRPSYRGRLVEGTSPIEISCWTSVLPWGSSANAIAELTDAQGRVVQSVQQDARSKQNFTLTLAAEGVAAGDYTLVVKLRNAGGAVLQTDSYSIQIVPQSTPQPTVYIDDHHRLIVHGQPMFPIGVYDRTSDLQAGLDLLKGTSFNFVMPYGWPAEKHFKWAQESGIYMFASLKDFYYGLPGTQDLIPTAADELKVIDSYVNLLKDQPALLGWYTVDELSPKYMDRIAAQYQLIRQLDPNHPTWAVYYQLGQIPQYMKACDVIGSDPYPIPGQPLSMVSQWTRTTIKQVAGAGPVWQALQSYNPKYFSHNDKDRAPTAQELHNMTWQAIADGANGIILYEFWIMRNEPDFNEHWPKVKQIADQVAMWSPVLLSIEPSPKVSAGSPGSLDWLSHRIQTWNGRTFIFAVNNTPQTQTVRFRTDAAIDHVNVVDHDNHRIAANGGAWNDEFAPLELKIYELNGAGLPLPKPQPVKPPAP
jgi:hypothetical protein